MQKNKIATPEERRLQRIAQLKAKLQKEEARLSKDKRKERDGQLIAFGVYVEEFFKSADMEGRKRLEESIKKHLSGRNLERALAGLARMGGGVSSLGA
jgi:hypothetical protein